MDSTKRILALDVMRGITIVGMIIFNTYSGFHYAPLMHAPWIGITMADMAFPFFMFIMGITTFLSLSKYGFEFSWPVARKILARTLGIVVVCWAFDWLGRFIYGLNGSDASVPLLERMADAANCFEHLRFSGVLVRLGVCYGICALASLAVSHKRFPWVIAGLLVAYFVLLLFGHGFEREPVNILGIVDRALLGENHMCNDCGIDPEGVLSTIPSVAHTMLGFWVGSRLFGKQNPLSVHDKVYFLFSTGAALTVAALLLYGVCPLSKKIWSPTFVMLTCGLGSLLLGMLVRWLDGGSATETEGGEACCRVAQCGRKGFAYFFRVFGANPLFLYLLSEGILWPLELVKVNANGEQTDVWGFVFWQWLVPVFGNYGGDLAFALLNVLFCWLVGWLLYRFRIFIRL